MKRVSTIVSPSGDHCPGSWRWFAVVSRSGSPVPSARMRNRLAAGLPSRTLLKLSHSPSGLQIGSMSIVSPKVKRVNVSRSSSSTQMSYDSSDEPMISSARYFPSGEIWLQP